MKKRRTKKQKKASQQKQATHERQFSLISTPKPANSKKEFSLINTQFIKKDLLKSLSITVIILILLFGIKLFLG